MAYTSLGITVALTLIGMPFVVRTVQPALQEVQRDLEDAAETLGAGRFYVFRRIIVPTVLPALLTGFTLAFARAVGEYGSVIFIAGNMPMKTEITPLLIIIRLEEFDYAGAAALGFVMLVDFLRDAARHQPAAGVGPQAHDGAPLTWPGRRHTQTSPPNSRPARAHQPALDAGALAADHVSLTFLGALLAAPLAAVFAMALEKGWGAYFAELRRSGHARRHPPDADSPRPIVVPLNTVFGITAAWCIAKFEFRGKSFLITLIDLPLAVSPVVSGLIYVLLFGLQRLVRRLAAGARHQHRLRVARHHARDHVRHLPVRGARAHSADAAARQRRGRGGHHARRRRLVHVLPCYAAAHSLGPGLRRHPVQRARHGRVRRRLRGLRATFAD